MISVSTVFISFRTHAGSFHESALGAPFIARWKSRDGWDSFFSSIALTHTRSSSTARIASISSGHTSSTDTSGRFSACAYGIPANEVLGAPFIAALSR